MYTERFCGLVVRVSGYRSRGPGFDFRPYKSFWEVTGLERGPLSLMRTTEELLGWKSSGSGVENRDWPPWEFVVLTTQHPLRAKKKKIGTNLADKRWSLCRYSSLAVYGHGVIMYTCYIFRPGCIIIRQFSWRVLLVIIELYVYSGYILVISNNTNFVTIPVFV
jgi:hypothetical protein